MIFKKMAVGMLGANCYIVGCEETKKCAIIDPGGNPEKIQNVIAKAELEVVMILLTHGHGDHISGAVQLKKKYGCPILLHGDDVEMAEDADLNHSDRFGAKVEFTPDRCVHEFEELEVGNKKLLILHTPGHTKGGISIKLDDDLFSGDTLFCGSVGRHDLYGGNGRQLIKSIKEKIYTLNDNVVVHPGHGPETTVGREKKSNPFTM